ncbi:hypothetical protein [Streptomyces sp. NBC_01669]|uniref:hypothetical protein n=1 Tax=Streptomyces sp. NBC_01669 TaxID=2975909 RepID=UPI002250CA32|nr:hypothetical protein [Streptomyces sp. NBC_01669]MCX4537701.1 hypothetical protein [Streptomyces sp. NBC_01669]
MTVRFDEQQAEEVDRLLLDLRADVGRRLDKAEVVRALLLLADDGGPVRRALVKGLKGSR